MDLTTAYRYNQNMMEYYTCKESIRYAGDPIFADGSVVPRIVGFEDRRRTRLAAPSFFLVDGFEDDALLWCGRTRFPGCENFEVK